MKKVKQLIDRAVAWGLPFLDVRMTQGGKTVAALGASRHGEALTGNERVYMYSCTKVMTSACICRLIDENALSLDTPVGDILPAFRTLTVEGKGNLAEPLRLVHLMTMTSGLTYDGPRRYPITAEVAARGERSVTRAIADALAGAPLRFTPGSSYQYSLSLDVAGAMVEAVTGAPFSHYVRSRFLDPLGMTDTYFGAPTDPTVTDAVRAEAGGVFHHHGRRNDLIYHEGFESGGAGLVSTVCDYTKFATMLAMGGLSPTGEVLLSPAAIERMRTPHVYPSLGFGCAQGEGYAYGLGVRTRTKTSAAGIPVGEFGWDGAAGSFILADTKNAVGIAMTTHLLGWGDKIPRFQIEIAEALYQALGIGR